MRLSDGDAVITLGLLVAVEATSALTQRSAASELGPDLAKHCVRRGLIKVHRAPANRYTYYLTPKGFAEKGRLTRQFLSASFNFVRRARSQCADDHRRVMLLLELLGWSLEMWVPAEAAVSVQ